MKNLTRRLMILLISLATTEASAAWEQLAPTQTGAQKEFSEFLKNGDYAAALMAWPNAHGNSSFGKSQNGVALQALLMSKNGLDLMAGSWVLRDTNPKKLDSGLRQEWTGILENQVVHQILSAKNTAWEKDLARVEWTKISSKADVKKAQNKLKNLPKTDVLARAQLYWSLVSQAPAQDHLNVAEGALKNLKNLNQTLVSADDLNMAQGRILFQKGQLNDAIVAYSQVSKASDMWLEALEERAWAYLRLQEYDKTTSEITTLMTPTFKELVGPEVFFLANLTALRICDYPRILDNGKKFKERHQDRIREIETLAQKGTNSKINEILGRMDARGVSLASVGADVKSFPRLALKSISFSAPYKLRYDLLSEIATAQSLKQKFSVVGENQSLNALIAWADGQALRAKNDATRALKDLARAEVQEYRTMINKLKLAEVEVIHHFSVDDSLKGKRGQLQSQSHGSDVLVFPYDDEVWLDELDNYQARVKDCPTAKGASL